jgi:hypothetical protein
VQTAADLRDFRDLRDKIHHWGGWRVECGEWRVESGGWRVEGGEWKGENGGWRVEGGEWRVESGRWRVDGGEWRGRSAIGDRRSLAARAIWSHVRSEAKIGK